MWTIRKKAVLQDFFQDTSRKRDLYSKNNMSLKTILVTSRLEWIIVNKPSAFVKLNSRLTLPQHYPCATNTLLCSFVSNYIATSATWSTWKICSFLQLHLYYFSAPFVMLHKRKNSIILSVKILYPYLLSPPPNHLSYEDFSPHS